MGARRYAALARRRDATETRNAAKLRSIAKRFNGLGTIFGLAGSEVVSGPPDTVTVTTAPPWGRFLLAGSR